MAEGKGVLWDMDGVIVDTAPFHFAAWQDSVAEIGVQFSEEDFRRTFGMRNDAIVRFIKGQDATEGEIWLFVERKEERFRRRIKESIVPLPGVLPLLEGLREAGFRMAIASSAPLKNVLFIAEALKIREYFQAIVSEQDVTIGKPDPQVFLIAADKLRLPPRCCVVIEDAVVGVRAAKAAGMGCVAVTNTHPGEGLAEADLVVASLEEVRASDIDTLIRC
ncbi:MAG: HAD family phosphatase [Chloroflexi bacterium]|nr:HAD family phosphatase [Chloroflexota bacterium]